MSIHGYPNNITSTSIHSPYSSVEVHSNLNTAQTKMFASRNMLSPYNREDVSDEFVRRLIVYTDAMLIGDIKTISTEYLYAAKAIMETLHYTRRPLRPEWVERMWADATQEEGHLPENFAKKLHDHIIR